MYWISVLVGLLIAMLEILAARSNRETRADGTASRLWISVHQARWIWGLSPALISLFVIYSVPTFNTGAENFRVAGLPFIVGVFGQNGRDFVSTLEIVIFTLVANAVVWFFLPSLFLWVWAKCSRRRSEGRHI